MNNKLNKCNIIIILVTLIMSYSFLVSEDFQIIPVPPRSGSSFEVQEYNYIGLLTQIKFDRLVISNIEFSINQPKIQVSKSNENSSDKKVTATGNIKIIPTSTPLYDIPGLDIRDENGKKIYLEELKLRTPAIIQFYSEDYSNQGEEPFSISKIKIGTAIQSDIPDSLYNYKR
ncbi:hypothetical protein JXI42_14440, partial [bacterium]|nr:hypothetical protein [bacterium]